MGGFLAIRTLVVHAPETGITGFVVITGEFDPGAGQPSSSNGSPTMRRSARIGGDALDPLMACHTPQLL